MSYTVSNAPPPDASPRPHVWWERLLLAAFLFSLLIGMGALALFFVVRDETQSSSNVNPLQSVRTELIAPQIALRELSGDAPAGLAGQALQAGHDETARAILTFATAIPGVEHAARLTALARHYLETDAPIAAAQVTELAVASAILDDAIPVRERVNLLTQNASILFASHAVDAASDAATQSLRITAQAPGLLPAQRSALFTDLRDAIAPYAEQSETARTLYAQVDDFARNPYLLGAGSLVTPTITAFVQPFPYDSPTQEKIAARQAAARILADRIELTGGVDIDPERQALAAALLAEDAARALFYQNPGEIARGQQLWLLFDRRAWLVEKLRVAMLGYGLSLLPEWETQLNQILAELDAANNYLSTVMTAYATEQATPTAQTRLKVETQHWLAQQAARGLYPGASVTTIGELLRSLQDDLAQAGDPLALPLAYDAAATPPGFRIQPAP